MACTARTKSEPRTHRGARRRSCHRAYLEGRSTTEFGSAAPASAVAGDELLGFPRPPGRSRIERDRSVVATRLDVDHWRWAGVPVYIRTGDWLAAHSPAMTPPRSDTFGEHSRPSDCRTSR